MRILSVNARNYRTLHNTNIHFARNYCTISGKNNAGKSCVIRLLLALFRRQDAPPWYADDFSFLYKEDKTQWEKQDSPIQIDYVLEFSRDADPAFMAFAEKISDRKLGEDTAMVNVCYSIPATDVTTLTVNINGADVDPQAAKEIVKKVQNSNLVFLYNSTTRHEEIYYGRGRSRTFYEVVLSGDEKNELDEAAQQLEKRLKRLAREHREGLNSILGRLAENYDVEFSPLEGYVGTRMPLGINLGDKNVEVPLNDWGSGTQNRTRILMAILQASRIKTRDSTQDRTTPVVIVEEPESFLHPSAQSEFGRVLRTLATDVGVQLIVTTHSPYMLNQEEPASNILLCRDLRRGKPFATKVVDTSGDNWMAPFSEHLGLSGSEFLSWRPVFSSYQSKVLLVEGPTDKEYFSFMQGTRLPIDPLQADIEVVPYDGKDTLKNTLLLQFVLSKFDHVFITYDLDAEGDVKSSLVRLGLKENRDFAPVGLRQAGRDAIEGLLPDRVLSTVNGRETDLVMRLHSKDNRERRNARDTLKKKYLAEFIAISDWEKAELKEMVKLITLINSRFAASAKDGTRGRNKTRADKSDCEQTNAPDASGAR